MVGGVPSTQAPAHGQGLKVQNTYFKILALFEMAEKYNFNLNNITNLCNHPTKARQFRNCLNEIIGHFLDYDQILSLNIAA